MVWTHVEQRTVDWLKSQAEGGFTEKPHQAKENLKVIENESMKLGMDSTYPQNCSE